MTNQDLAPKAEPIPCTECGAPRLRNADCPRCGLMNGSERGASTFDWDKVLLAVAAHAPIAAMMGSHATAAPVWEATRLEPTDTSDPHQIQVPEDFPDL